MGIMIQRTWEAVLASKSGWRSSGKAAQLFGIPKSTRSNRIVGKVVSGAWPRRQPIIPLKLEETIVKKVIAAAEQEFGLSHNKH